MATEKISNMRRENHYHHPSSLQDIKFIALILFMSGKLPTFQSFWYHNGQRSLNSFLLAQHI